MIPCEDYHESRKDAQHVLSDVLSSCRLYTTNNRAREMLVNVSIDELDNDNYRIWMECTQFVNPISIYHYLIENLVLRIISKRKL